jgi:membrane-bound lytic murein transglycosylase A
LAREARAKAHSLAGLAIGVIALALSMAASDAFAARRSRAHSPSRPPLAAPRQLPYPQLELPLQITGTQYAPVAWSDIPGWSEDDHLAAYKAFRTSCRPIAAQTGAPSDSKALGTSLRDPCRFAKGSDLTDSAVAKTFFEQNFLPLRISRLGEGEGFVTGYYEPVIDGSLTQNEVYNVPVYRRPSNLFVRGTNQNSAGLPNKGQVFRKIGRRKLVPYYDRAEIEDGAIEGRGLEIDRGIIPKDQMSMQKIREWMEQNPDGANELRRQNRSYIFFREVQLSDKDEAVGAQGVPLTPGRSIAVDKSLHVYGTPFFIEGQLPIDSEVSKTPFHRLMIAQDTGSAIVGPARADLYFGAGVDAGKIAGRLKNTMRFVILVPKSLDPSARGRLVPVPDARPSEKIAKLFPQTDPLKDQKIGAPAVTPPAAGSTQKPATPTAQATSTSQATVAKPVPLPEARPSTAPAPEKLRRRRYRR